MNSALKPLSQPGVPQAGGQASPAKANVATANHAVGLPQGAQNSLHHASNNLVGQNLVHHVPNTPQLPPHAAPSMAPVSANMAQMAQNMSHHGNLSHVNPLLAPSPSKAPAPSAPLSLVQEKANASQPLALTRTPDKKEPESSAQANGTIDSPKSGSNTPTSLKPQNPESNKDKLDIAKTSPSTPKPPEKTNPPTTPQKGEATTPVNQADGPTQSKVATANEPPEKSPSKPTELKPAQTADVAPTQSDTKPVPESANDSQCQEKAATPPKQEPLVTENAKVEAAKVEVPKTEEKEEPKVEKPVEDKKEEPKVDNVEPSKPDETDKPQKVEEKVEEKKPEIKPIKPEVKVVQKSTLKLATVTPPMRKRRQVSDISDGSTSAKKGADDGTPDARTKRNRTKVQLYQSPTPEIAMATKLSASAGRSTPTKQNDDKLIVFYKNEYLAVRNAEGGFYVCQAMQNVYRATRKIKIRWLSQDKSDSTGETYKPDFYDVTDMECVLTTLSLSRAGGAAGAGAQRLAAGERARATSILQRALRAEAGDAPHAPHLLTPEHPDGLDLSLYTDESQLEKRSRKRTSSKCSPRARDLASDAAEAATPSKKARATPKRSPKSARKSKPTPKALNNKRSAGSTPNVASTSKTATAVTEKAGGRAGAQGAGAPAGGPGGAGRPRGKPAARAELLPARKGRRPGKERKASPIAPTPSTSTGKSTRTPRKPPAKK